MSSIIAAVDFSDVSGRVVDTASELSACFDAHVYLVHVAAPPPDFVGERVGPAHERQGRAEELRHEKKQLEAYAETLRDAGHEATPLLIQGATAETLLKEIGRLDARMIVMGSHGHGLAFQALVGSVSHQVLEAAKCPVVLVPSRQA